MKKIFLLLCCGLVCVAFSAQAQIDLGIDEGLDITTDETLEQDIDSAADSSKGSSLFDKVFSFFSPSESSSRRTANLNIDELKEKAETGDVEAQLDLGYMYLYGAKGIPVDYNLALSYYQKAAEQKNPIALNNLGSLYFNGIGTEVDYAKAIQYFEEATQLGCDDAAVNLAIIYLGSDVNTKDAKDLDKIIQLLKQAQQNNNIAKYILGYCYYRGFLVEQDYAKAFPLIKAAADAEYDEAQFVLADFYINGWGTPKNYSRAVQYLKSASLQGNAEAMVKLGDILSEGKYYTKDIEDAHVQYNIAAVMGVEDAALKRDALEKNIKIDDLLSVQSEAEDYEPKPSGQTTFIRKTYGNSLKTYIDMNFKIAKKFKKAGDLK